MACPDESRDFHVSVGTFGVSPPVSQRIHLIMSVLLLHMSKGTDMSVEKYPSSLYTHFRCHF